MRTQLPSPRPWPAWARNCSRPWHASSC